MGAAAAGRDVVDAAWSNSKVDAFLFLFLEVVRLRCRVVLPSSTSPVNKPVVSLSSSEELEDSSDILVVLLLLFFVAFFVAALDVEVERLV